MCHQTTGLVAAELERHGIVTAAVTMLPEITRKVRTPRALSVPYKLGFPLGEANNPGLQREVLKVLLELTRHDEVPFIAEL